MKLGNGPDSLRARLESVKKQLGFVPPELENLLELPEEMIFIWKYFMDLNSKRQNTGYGFLPLTYSEIKAYYDLFDLPYDSFEVQIICLLDSVAMQYYNEEAEKKQQELKNKTK